jgi:hypothetical protein
LISADYFLPYNILTNVVFPVPFSPNRTIISDELKVPGSTVSWNYPSPKDLCISGYLVPD